MIYKIIFVIIHEYRIIVNLNEFLFGKIKNPSNPSKGLMRIFFAHRMLFSAIRRSTPGIPKNPTIRAFNGFKAI